jgi:drug/metabolite transporter (DMT)-like permease
VHTSTLTLLVAAGIFAVAFGAFGFWLESRRRGRKQAALGVGLGMPGVYIVLCGSLEHIRALSIVGVVLVVVAWVGQVVLMIRAGGSVAPAWKQTRGLPLGKGDKAELKERRYDEW